MSLLQQADQRLVAWAHAWVRRAGFTLERLPENAPKGLQACLRDLLATATADSAVLYSGSSRVILEQLRAARPGWTSTLPPSGRLTLAIADLAPGQNFDWSRVCAALGPHGRLLVRLPPAGGEALAALQAEWERAGFRMIDVPEYPRSAQPVEAIEMLALLLAPLGAPEPEGPAAARIDELRTWLGGPLGGRVNSRRLAGPASGPGWDAVFNPGAVARPDGTLLLCRVEDATWSEMQVDETVFMRRCPPRLLALDASGQVRTTRETSWTAAPAANTHRMEDFRLFAHGGRVLSNHALLRLPAPARAGQPVDLDRIETRVAFSLLDPERGELRFIGEPKLPRVLGRTEKNWVCFTEADDLFLLHSPAPFLLYRCTNWERLEFAPVIEASWRLPDEPRSGLPSLRNSINPVPYDGEHWLHVVHRVYPGKRYAYWPVLISRRTLRPVQASRQPLACGGWTGTEGLIYLSAVLPGPDQIDLYFGAEDCATGHSQVSRSALDAAWRPVAAQ